MRRTELLFSAFCAASGSMAALALLGGVRLSGTLALGLYPLYSLAALSGWICGNLFVARARRSSDARGPTHRPLLFAVYLVGPAGPLSLLRAMDDPEALALAPAVPLFAFGVHVVLFLVPVTLRSTAPTRRSSRLKNGASAQGPGDPEGPRPG